MGIKKKNNKFLKWEKPEDQNQPKNPEEEVPQRRSRDPDPNPPKEPEDQGPAKVPRKPKKVEEPKKSEKPRKSQKELLLDKFTPEKEEKPKEDYPNPNLQKIKLVKLSPEKEEPEEERALGSPLAKLPEKLSESEDSKLLVEKPPRVKISSRKPDPSTKRNEQND